MNNICPLGTRRTNENQLIRVRLKCYYVGCKRRVQGVEGFNGKFYYKGTLVGDLRDCIYLCKEHCKSGEITHE